MSLTENFSKFINKLQLKLTKFQCLSLSRLGGFMQNSSPGGIGLSVKGWCFRGFSPKWCYDRPIFACLFCLIFLILDQRNFFAKKYFFPKRPKKIDPLFSVTWSKTECGMRNYLFTFYFGLKMIQGGQIFLIGQNSCLPLITTYIYKTICVLNKLYL